MDTLEKLNKQAEQDQERIDRLNAKMAAAEAAITKDPDNSKAAIEAAAANMQAQAAQKALDNTRREIAAEKARLYEQEVIAARAELAEIEAQAEKIREREFTKARVFFAEYEAWLALVNRHAEIAREYGIAAPKLAALDEGQEGITKLKWALDHWTAARASLEIRRKALRAAE